ncbi:MAG TPA: hypothetical protein PLG66_19875, partial [Calditrichia bacterium]|nr:hypothetical protein [Calditrichia bacterium]
PMGNQAIVGLYLNRPLNLPVPVNASNLIFLRHATDLIFSFPVGDKALGFRFTGAYADADAESSPIDSLALSEQARYFELAGGVSSPFYDFSAFFGLPQVLSETRNDTYDWSGIGFGVAGRFFLGPEDGLQYVPAVILNNFTSIYDVNGVESDRTYLEFRMLGGVRYQINAENLVVAGLEVFGIRQDEGDTPDVISERTRITNMPAFYIGAETHALRWLFLRVGAVQRYQETESSYKLPNTSRVTDRRWASDFDFYFGAGVRFGAFQLDLDINDQFLFDGPDFISGSGSSGRFANRVSVSYEF